MKIRVFGASWCQSCLNSLSLIKKTNIPISYIDVDSEKEEVQLFCDENKVDEIPHFQFISDSDYVILEHIGPLTIEELNEYIKDMKDG